MNVSLTPELERPVTQKVESGLYQTASEVVREGLRLLAARDARSPQTASRPKTGSARPTRRSPHL